MLIAAADIDFDGDVDSRALALSLLPDARPTWSLQDLLDFEPGLVTISRLSSLDVDGLDEDSASVALELLERQQAWLASLVVRVTGAGRRPDAAATGSGQHRHGGA